MPVYLHQAKSLPHGLSHIIVSKLSRPGDPIRRSHAGLVWYWEHITNTEYLKIAILMPATEEQSSSFLAIPRKEMASQHCRLLTRDSQFVLHFQPRVSSARSQSLTRQWCVASESISSRQV